MPIVISTRENRFNKIKEQFRKNREKRIELEKKDLYGSVELPDNIENEYKELDKREINILNRELNGFINDNISFYSGNGEKAVLEANFNEMYNVLFCDKKLEDVKDKSFLYHTRTLTKLLLTLVNCDEYRYRRYDIDISSSNSIKKKQEIKKLCEKLFLNILTRKYNILREQDKLDFKLPSKEEETNINNELLNKLEQVKNDLDNNKSKILE